MFIIYVYGTFFIANYYLKDQRVVAPGFVQQAVTFFGSQWCGPTGKCFMLTLWCSILLGEGTTLFVKERGEGHWSRAQQPLEGSWDITGVESSRCMPLVVLNTSNKGLEITGTNGDKYMVQTCTFFWIVYIYIYIHIYIYIYIYIYICIYGYIYNM